MFPPLAAKGLEAAECGDQYLSSIPLCNLDSIGFLSKPTLSASSRSRLLTSAELRQGRHPAEGGAEYPVQQLLHGWPNVFRVTSPHSHSYRSSNPLLVFSILTPCQLLAVFQSSWGSLPSSRRLVLVRSAQRTSAVSILRCHSSCCLVFLLCFVLVAAVVVLSSIGLECLKQERLAG